ncbi:uncharacterized protein LOC122533131 [Frieseomelitta varia]|uniref:uncharacterized protein LOC122533131 n=1 Tax=Frieseomelitta varia TaxID=561572 RepID=UPI001CB69BEB|nr:uncharacterized protein LOC122533131 [Frieseomelitta varia]
MSSQVASYEFKNGSPIKSSIEGPYATLQLVEQSNKLKRIGSSRCRSRNIRIFAERTFVHDRGATLCKFTQEVRVVAERPLRRPRRRRLPGGIRERSVRGNGELREIEIITGGTDRKSCNTVVSRRYGLPTGAYRYTQALCRTEVEYGLYWRHLLHG